MGESSKRKAPVSTISPSRTIATIFWMCFLGGGVGGSKGWRGGNKRNLLRRKHCFGVSFWERHFSIWSCPFPFSSPVFHSFLPVPTGKPAAVDSSACSGTAPSVSICLTGPGPSGGIDCSAPHSPAAEMAERGSRSNSESLPSGQAELPEVTAELFLCQFLSVVSTIMFPKCSTLRLSEPQLRLTVDFVIQE